MDFWDIYHNHYERVRKFIFALVKDEWVADDLIQETFIKVQKNLDQLKDETKLSSWIFEKVLFRFCELVSGKESANAQQRFFVSDC